MIFVGMAIILFSVVVRGFLFPTEYSLGDDKDESRRVFFNPIIVFVYWLIERGCRWGGATLIVFDIVGFNGSLMTILLGGMFTGGIAMVIAPMLSMWLALRIHPYFKQTLGDRN